MLVRIGQEVQEVSRQVISLSFDAPRVLSQGQGPLTAKRGRGRALAYRSAPHHLEPLVCDAAGQRLARNPLPRATRQRAQKSRWVGLAPLLLPVPFRRVPVVNETGELAGIIAMADIALEMEDEREIAETLEEISSGSSFWKKS